MRAFALLLCPLLVASLVGAADPSPEPDEDNDAKTIIGNWQAIKAIKEGMPAPASEVEKLQLKVTKDKLTIVEGRAKGTREEAVSYKLDMKSKPRGIDIFIDIGKKDTKATLQGIYKIEKGELTIHFSKDGGERPKTFDEKTRTLLVFRKVKATK